MQRATAPRGPQERSGLRWLPEYWIAPPPSADAHLALDDDRELAGGLVPGGIRGRAGHQGRAGREEAAGGRRDLDDGWREEVVGGLDGEGHDLAGRAGPVEGDHALRAGQRRSDRVAAPLGQEA